MSGIARRDCVDFRFFLFFFFFHPLWLSGWVVSGVRHFHASFLCLGKCSCALSFSSGFVVSCDAFTLCGPPLTLIQILVRGQRFFGRTWGWVPSSNFNLFGLQFPLRISFLFFGASTRSPLIIVVILLAI